MSPLGGPETNLPPSVEPGSLYRTEIERVWRERAVRWEAIARQLGEALDNYMHRNGDEILAEALAALSVYRDAIKEDE